MLYSYLARHDPEYMKLLGVKEDRQPPAQPYQTVTGGKDRSLAGKARVRARRAR